MYYFLKQYGGPTLVFVNSIAVIRRLIATLSELDTPVFKLHAAMQQRQRLKNLEKYVRANVGGLLLAEF